MRKIISRPDRFTIPAVPLPIHIRSVGYNEAPPGWAESEPPEEKPFVQIFWCVQGVGEFQIGDKIFQLHPDEAIYRLPGERHCHRAADPKTPWHYWWFTFDGPGARDFLLSYGYEQKPYHAGPCPTTLFSELETLVVKPNLYSQRHALSVAAEILALFGCVSSQEEPDTVRKFLHAVEAYYYDSAFTIESAAQLLKLHRTTLYRIVERELSCSPKQYLQNFRIQKALSLLLETSKPVKEIAVETGFNKVDRFCAVIARTTGHTPAVYRKLSEKRTDSKIS